AQAREGHRVVVGVRHVNRHTAGVLGDLQERLISGGPQRTWPLELGGNPLDHGAYLVERALGARVLDQPAEVGSLPILVEPLLQRGVHPYVPGHQRVVVDARAGDRLRKDGVGHRLDALLVRTASTSSMAGRTSGSSPSGSAIRVTVWTALRSGSSSRRRAMA